MLRVAKEYEHNTVFALFQRFSSSLFHSPGDKMEAFLFVTRYSRHF